MTWVSKDTKKAAKEHKKKRKEGETGVMVTERSCTDCICCLIFVGFIIFTGVICCYGLAKGDPARIITPYDSDGNQCGMPDQCATEKIFLADAGGTFVEEGAGKTPCRDFTSYKYKYFTGFVGFAKNGFSLDSLKGAMYNAYCVQECPATGAVDALGDVDKTKVPSKMACMINSVDKECLYSPFGTSPMMKYCLPKKEDAKAVFTKLSEELQKDSTVTFYIVEMKESWPVLLIMTFGALIITVLYMFLLKWLTKPILYISLILILLGGVALGGFSTLKYIEYKNLGQEEYEKYSLIFTIIVWVLVLLYVCFLCCQCTNIRLGAEIMGCASEFVSQNWRVTLLPIIGYIATIPVYVWWVISVVFIYSCGEPEFKENSFIANIKWQKGIKEMLWIMLFALFWIVAFILAIQRFVIACVCCQWYQSYESDEGSNASVLKATIWSFRYHLGSLAFGSFLIAVIKMIKAIFEYFAKKGDAIAGNNPFWKAIKWVARCYLWCLEKYIQFINDNAYIQIALNSVSFCTAAWTSFYLIVRHLGKFGASIFISKVLVAIGKGLILMLSAAATWALCQYVYPEISQPIIPTVIIAIIAYFIASLFLIIYDFAGLTILHCFIQDQDYGGTGNTPKGLRSFIDNYYDKDKKDSDDSDDDKKKSDDKPESNKVD